MTTAELKDRLAVLRGWREWPISTLGTSNYVIPSLMLQDGWKVYRLSSVEEAK